MEAETAIIWNKHKYFFGLLEYLFVYLLFPITHKFPGFPVSTFLYVFLLYYSMLYYSKSVWDCVTGLFVNTATETGSGEG